MAVIKAQLLASQNLYNKKRTAINRLSSLSLNCLGNYAFALLFGAKKTGAKIAANNTATPNTTDMVFNF